MNEQQVQREAKVKLINENVLMKSFFVPLQIVKGFSVNYLLPIVKQAYKSVSNTLKKLIIINCFLLILNLKTNILPSVKTLISVSCNLAASFSEYVMHFS